MDLHHICRFFGCVVASAWVVLTAPVAPASAEPCPDVEVVFARGTSEPPGLGEVGERFVDSLRARAGARSLAVYPVDYPASTDFPTALDGINDAGAHIESMAVSCPKTSMVLGGYSQGAAVMGFVTADRVPDGAHAVAIPQPMPSAVADHVAAVTLFGKPSEQFMNTIGQPAIAIGPGYAAKPSTCAFRTTRCALARETSSPMANTWRRGWSISRQISPRVTSRSVRRRSR